MITDSTESQSAFRKEIATPKPKVGKSEYFAAPNQPTRSTGPAFFTGDAQEPL